ncbi:DUF3180 domain-containing protein [Pseudonocardia sp. ICBG1293]|uniref:DUF3180 domain-containing protein n=1 Tax=Pseudonocardia sp. ICBG1293 TaxID=2844382 RepID=UPI001CCEF64E|nr:DUF3180 domain-containing protein [Pseudonocardia sp. ICBG1293]
MTASGPGGRDAGRGPGGDPRPTVRPTRVRDVAAIAVVAALLGNIGVQLTYGMLPTLPVAAAVVVVVLAVAEVAGGVVLRRRIERRNGAAPVPPLVAARAVLVAKASAIGGAVVTGLWVGVLMHTLPLSPVVVAAFRDSVVAGIGVVSALLLVGAGFWLEYCCRAPDDPDDTDGGIRTG